MEPKVDFLHIECFKYDWQTFIVFILTLEDKDIIQVDATVIIGVMILLTLSIGFDSSINAHAQKNASITRLMITLAIIAPFTASAVLAILTSLTNKYTEQLKKTSIIIMAVGFGYLIFVIAAFMASIYSLIWVTTTFAIYNYVKLNI